jgi:hypothetical protein
LSSPASSLAVDRNQRAPSSSYEPAPRELLEDLLGEPAIAHVALLGRPHFEVHAIVAEHAALLAHEMVDGPPAEVLDALAWAEAEGRRRGPAWTRPVLLQVARREIDDVVAGISALRDGRLLANGLAHAGLERQGEPLELSARVVDVVLAGHRRTLGAQQPGQRVAHGGRARVHDHQRSGGIRRHELDADTLARVARAMTVPRAGFQDLAHGAGRPRRRQEDVQEARTGHLEPCDLVELRKVLHHGVGYLARRPARRLGEHHRHVRRVIAVLGLARHFPGDVLRLRQARRGQSRAHRLRQPLGDRHECLAEMITTSPRVDE